MNTALPHSPWIVCPERRPHAAVRLFCFPCAGRGVSLYRTWSKALGPAIEVSSVQLPGREERLNETPITDFHELTETLL